VSVPDRSVRLTRERLPLGYYLRAVGTRLPWSPERTYRGIDRPPPIPSPVDVSAANESGDRAWGDLWDSYWNAEDSGELHLSRNVAEGFRRRFLMQGTKLEIIYAEILAVPLDLVLYPHGSLWAVSLKTAREQLTTRKEKFLTLPDGLSLLGFDISTPEESFHSAIFHPGLPELCPGLRDSLNSSGLLDDWDTTARFLQRALAMDYGVSPFSILGIWSASDV